MSSSRRDFIKQAAMLSGSLGSFSALPPALARALSIDPEPGSTFMDAKHVVVLMQENRSFDHVFGTFRGARGFDDPRAITLANGDPVFLQSYKGNTYKPFNLDIHGSNATWMGGLPHGRGDQLEAGNNGKHDRWLQAKGRSDFLSFTLGYYDEKDVPFYHAFADSFTLCDQHYCSIQTSTTPNRSYLWSGTIRYNDQPDIPPCVTNGMLDRHHHQSWTTFPERLTEAGISWRVYQNEISEPTGLGGAEDSWLANFTNNPLEWFSQYHAGSYEGSRTFLQGQAEQLRQEITKMRAESQQAETALATAQKMLAGMTAPGETATAEAKAAYAEKFAMVEKRDKEAKDAQKALGDKTTSLEKLERHLAENPSLDDPSIPEISRHLHTHAFTNNSGDPNYRKLASIEYERDGKTQKVDVPAGDPFYQFRKDVAEGKLPTVSWLVASSQFSDHPSSAWYGAWYVAEALNILTSNPEVWKNTIFILNYDENDGYFDHVPPYNPPRPDDPGTGKTSPDIDTTLEFEHNKQPLGLGFRVPLIVASPWTRGGHICSEIFDITSVIRFLEVFLSNKTKKPIRETNITSWRRHIIGDLTNVFQSGPNLAGPFPPKLDRDEFVTTIHRARFMDRPPENPPLTKAEIEEIRANPRTNQLIPPQRPGTRVSRALPYELYADAALASQGRELVLELAAANQHFGKRALGAPFQVYAPEGFNSQTDPQKRPRYEKMRRWSFALSAGSKLDYAWPLEAFPDAVYHLELHGPNGFFRKFRGSADDPALKVRMRYGKDDTLVIALSNASNVREINLTIRDVSYARGEFKRQLAPGTKAEIPIPLDQTGRWYDFAISVDDAPDYLRQYAGRMENGRDSITDPLIGNRLS